VIARYWNERGKFTSHPPTTKTHCNRWLDFFGEKSVEDAMEYAEQERFKTALAGRRLSPQSINNILSTGRAALRTLLAQLRDHAWLLNVLLIGTLARPSSILQIDWEQMDFEADLIFLNKPGRRQTKKRRLVVKMPPFLKAILLPLRGEGPVITFEGKRVKSVKTAWRKGRERAGFDDTVTLYSWRHTRGDSLGTPQWEMSANSLFFWCRLRGLNSRPSVYKTAALPLS
jgi:integrase